MCNSCSCSATTSAAPDVALTRVQPSGSLSYLVSGMTCGHCKAAVTREVSRVAGVSSVDVDLATKLVRVHGADVDDAAVRAAIDEAGYEAVPSDNAPAPDMAAA